MWRRPLKFATATASLGGVGAAYYALSDRKDSTNAHRLVEAYTPSFLLRHPLHAEAQGQPITAKDKTPHSLWTPPSRREMVNELKGLPKETKEGAKGPGGEFDLLIVGGGATGTGCAVDAATRGLRVALVERDDFASGTSSRSTKLVHGGVRYLEKAFWELDYEQYKLVKEALHERGVFLKIAPFLSYQLPTMIPLYKMWKLPYYWAGCKAYDALAWFSGDALSNSYFLSKQKALEAFPMLKQTDLVAALVYYDGAHNDARMNVALALTAVAHGAVVANHTEVVRLLKKKRTTHLGLYNLGPEEIYGAIVRDHMTGEEWEVRAKGVINATGPFTDGLRKLDSGVTTAEIVAPSSGTHIVLPSYYSPRDMGLIDPATSDGRVIFFLPWQGSTIAGTTDAPTEVTQNPIPTEKEIAWILSEIENYLSPDIKVRRGDVLAAWSGIRPLVRDPHAKNTAALVRNHMINVSANGLLTIAGGKWTTYREMAAETIDKAIEVFDLKASGPSNTEHVLLVGSHHWDKNMYVKLVQHFGIEVEVAQHLSEAYGDRAWGVAAMASLTGSRWPVFGKHIAPGYPYIEAEVRYAVRREYACTAVDVIARRTRLAFLNAQAALEALPRVIEIMAEELNWSKSRKQEELAKGKEFLVYMGLRDPSTSSDASFFERSHFRPEELTKAQAEFSKLDADKDGHINQSDLKTVMKTLGQDITKADLETVLTHVELRMVDSIEFNEFLEILGVVKEMKNRSKFSHRISNHESVKVRSTERSGGGV
ncbi:FAD dependent oxidoreductase-domain-containing protein [Fimicolochytrium jonesii]|uniref:FAD dependent oxidoreductase-domain-containing protein n=1 Tax=Fimicolochytrium jonesii TaxID=1396493 RepID=UPI0022FF1D8F|nr:FAD dependent oxidoreductase-domain-containing protein [Fimicolochytrium jonesii]KAI8825296.1 FAD dependent oxidoreductase-domain-containing protein [Fimicolochytrium jonesii]